MKKYALALAAILLGLSMSACSSSTGGGGGGAREFESGDLNNGDSFSHVFTRAASVPYYCFYHGGAGGAGMSGTVTVSVPGTPYTPITIPISIAASFLPDISANEGDTVIWINAYG